ERNAGEEAPGVHADIGPVQVSVRNVVEATLDRERDSLAEEDLDARADLELKGEVPAELGAAEVVGHDACADVEVRHDPRPGREVVAEERAHARRVARIRLELSEDVELREDLDAVSRPLSRGEDAPARAQEEKVALPVFAPRVRRGKGGGGPEDELDVVVAR